MTDYTTVTPWPVRWSCDVSTYSATATGTAVQLATATIWALTGRQFGLTTVTLRPCRDYARDTPFPDAWLSWPGTQQPPLGATASGGYWGYWGVPALCGSCSQGCSCTGLATVRLPAPVHAVTSVRVDGAPLVTGSWRVDDYRWLVRTDGLLWPTQNNMSLDDTHLGTWSVTAVFGTLPPPGSEVAVGELACQLLRAMNGEDCRLPSTVTSLVRQGVTIQMPDPAQMFQTGLTGLYTVDLFIQTWNPGRLRARAQTYAIDRPTHRRVGT